MGVRTNEESLGVESEIFLFHAQATSGSQTRLHQQSSGSDGRRHIRLEEENPAHERPRLQGCRKCAAWVSSYWHAQQKCQYVSGRHCHGQMCLNAVWPHAGRHQGCLPHWHTELLGACHDLHRWTPPVRHVHRVGESVCFNARHCMLRRALVPTHLGGICSQCEHCHWSAWVKRPTQTLFLKRNKIWSRKERTTHCCGRH